MESNSVSSSPPSKLNKKVDESLSEESGWTQYIQEFDETSYNSGCSMSGSMVSDAGSGPEWKRKNNIKHLAPTVGFLPNMPKRLNFKNKRTQDISFDDSLEDTASSPVNSPKIATYFKRMDINSRKIEKDNVSPMGNETSIDEVVEFNDFNGEHLKANFGYEVQFMELKQKGLCVVPVSMAQNYLGCKFNH